ncbi:MAG: DNA phosphorothioation-associated putative methyltransferase, partial [Bryobacteraceae bacterium]
MEHSTAELSRVPTGDRHALTLEEYQSHLAQLTFGKRLPTALYVYRGEPISLGPELDQLVTQVVAAFEIDPVFNVLKFRLDELKISFLHYPNFIEDPHPALQRAITVDLVRGKNRITDYSENPNPPILHRKETFLPPSHPRRNEFEVLTRAEEAAGLYENSATIGFKLNWERLLASKCLVVEDHSLRRRETNDGSPESIRIATEIHRHKTALTRYALSKPIKGLLEYGQLKPGTTLFDYGCGPGSDITGLRGLGYQAEGWDPVHRPDVPKRAADVVNLGYVLNVIEDPAERLESLVDAYRHAGRLLVVSGLIQETVDTDSATAFRDGVLTKRHTFQKYFDQQELQQYIEDALDSTAVPVA